MTYRLQLEPVPEKAWGVNLRSALSPSEWDRARRKVYEDAGHLCEICGGRGPTHPVECHEVWLFDEKAAVQRLERLEALCPLCHSAKHLGMADRLGRGGEALEQLRRVNGLSQDELAEYLRWAWARQERMSGIHWRLDLSWLEERRGYFLG